MDWASCMKNANLVKKVGIDKNLILSLMKSSAKKFISQGLLELNENTSSSKVSLMYDSLRELLEGLALSKGYKIYNHECYTYLLKEALNESALGDSFNDFRRIRNSINYYGKDIAPEEAKMLLAKMSSMINLIKNKYFG